jgi:type II secretory pathway predicted ATPase ExeA
MSAYRARFGLAHDPLPRDASGKTCFCDGEDFARVSRIFAWLCAEPGLGLLTGEAGLGKTTLLRHLCDALPAPEHRVLYICDTAVTPAAVYRNLAAALGLVPKFRRDALWRQLEAAITKLVEEQSIVPVLIIDEAQHLSNDFLYDLAGFLNTCFDRHDLLTVWLVGLPSLQSRLRLQAHAPLYGRVVTPLQLHAKSRDELISMVRHGLRVAGARDKIVADPALEVLYRVSRGVPRTAAKLLRLSLVLAHDRDQSFVDEPTMLDACAELDLDRPRQPASKPISKPRRKSRR